MRRVFGTLIRGVVDESKRPVQALAGNCHESFGAHATPTLMVYDRGGSATATLRALAREVSNRSASSPRATGVERCRGRPRDGQKAGGKTERIIGTLKTDTDGVNKPGVPWHGR